MNDAENRMMKLANRLRVKRKYQNKLVNEYLDKMSREDTRQGIITTMDISESRKIEFIYEWEQEIIEISREIIKLEKVLNEVE